MDKVIVIGLDAASPELIFDKWADDLPTLNRLTKEGISGELESCIPPITVPAWSSMMSGKDPGTLGMYGFRNRKNYSYDDLYFPTSNTLKEDRIWDILSKKGLKSVVMGVPQTYPPTELNGCMISSFMTPDTSTDYTYPKELKHEIEDLVGEYKLDVENFRTNDKERLLKEIYSMTKKRFKAAQYLLENKSWDFFMLVEMGSDRIQHGFWKYFAPDHRDYEKGNIYEEAIFKYYRFLDEKIGELISKANDAAVIIVSDHGVKTMFGGICINEWLINEGLLSLKNYPDELTPIRECDIDWENTKAWGYGGYYGRIFLNVKGREPRGVIPKEKYEDFRSKLVKKLIAIPDENGEKLNTRVYKPEEIYDNTNNIPPDLIVYFDDLGWRSVGSVGDGKVHTFENDTGPDYANHSRNGIFIQRGNPPEGGRRIENLKITDVAPTILDEMGHSPPSDMKGVSIKQKGVI